ncbi:GFA family protein [Aliikangiella maris]|uniref:GFA family protein n=2 Tax=Aliikangiella maris TaxID=3162458 RepID=A0ABV2BXY6_9GAMM
MQLNGSCLCGSVSFTISGKLEKFYLCHCHYCQKDSGSAHAANLFFSAAELEWQCGLEQVKQFQLMGTHHMKSFCGVCGSAIPSKQPNIHSVVVPAGCIDGQLNQLPDAHLFNASKAQWETQAATIPRFEFLPEY